MKFIYLLLNLILSPCAVRCGAQAKPSEFCVFVLFWFGLDCLCFVVLISLDNGLERRTVENLQYFKILIG